MDKKKKPSGAFKRKQRQEREESKKNCPKLTNIFSLLQVLLEKIFLLIVTQIMW